MTDIFHARRSRGAPLDSEDDDYSDSDLTVTSNEDDYSVGGSAEETSDYDTESDEYGETETEEEYEEEISLGGVVDSQPETPEESNHSTLPTVVENGSMPAMVATENVSENTKHEPQFSTDNINTSSEPVFSYNQPVDIVAVNVEQPVKEMIPKQVEEVERYQQVQVTHQVGKERHREEQSVSEEHQQTVTSQETDESHNTENPQEKRIQEHREYRRKLAEDPSFVPYVGLFWSHDDRYREDSLTETRPPPAVVPAAVAKPSQNTTPHDPLMNKKWDHNGYEELVRMEEADKIRDSLESEQQHDTQPNRQHFNKPPPPRHNSNTHQPKEKWPAVSSNATQVVEEEKTDVASISWATVTIDDLEEHGKPANRNWNGRSYTASRRTQHGDRRGQPSFRESRFKQVNARVNSDNNSSINQNSKPQQVAKNFGGWNSKPDTSNSMSKTEWDNKSKKADVSWSNEPVGTDQSNTGWGIGTAIATADNGGGWDSVSATKDNGEWQNTVSTGDDATITDKKPENEKANTGWGDLSSIKENTSWSNTPKTNSNATVSPTNNIKSNFGWNKSIDRNNKQKYVPPVRNYGWNHAGGRSNSNNNWRSKNSPQKESSASDIQNEKAASQWSQPIVTVNIDLSTATSDGWGNGDVIINSENSRGLDIPAVTTIDLATPETTPKVVEVTGWNASPTITTTATENTTNGWSNPSPQSDNTNNEKASSNWGATTTAVVVDHEKNTPGSLGETVNNEKATGWGSSVEVDNEKATGWGTSVEQTVDSEKTPEWGAPPITVKHIDTSGWNKLESVEEKESHDNWVLSNTNATTEKPSNQESLEYKNSSGWDTVHDTVEKETKEVEVPKTKQDTNPSSQEDTERKETANTRSTLNASANGWTGSDNGSPSWTPNLNWGGQNELSGRKGYLSQKTETPIINAEPIELPIDTCTLHDSYEDDSDVEIILEEDDADRSNNEPVLGISAPERPAITVDEPWEKKTPTHHHFMTNDDYSQQPQNIPMYYTSQMYPNGAVTYVPVLPNGPNSSPMFMPYSMGIPVSPTMGSPINSHSGGVSPRKYYSPIPGPSVLHPPPGYEANGMVYYGVDPSAMYPPQQYYYMSQTLPSSGDYIEQDEGEGWGPAPEAPEKEAEWSKEPHSQQQSANYPQSYYYYY
ncbi:hypothetical protein K501DRAFT_336775 [Backusella circina FSU 941]|nr:hypothetical protein K501DRAFT_336775 [Backusella circina FSU 941]